MKNIDLFKTLLKINAVTFGGGYTIVPIIRDEFVKNKKIIDDDEMMKIIALAQSCPGAMAINTSILLGYRINKTKEQLQVYLQRLFRAWLLFRL